MSRTTLVVAAFLATVGAGEAAARAPNAAPARREPSCLDVLGVKKAARVLRDCRTVSGRSACPTLAPCEALRAETRRACEAAGADALPVCEAHGGIDDDAEEDDG